jgi:RNA polymerase sigma-70 factor (ECF subfamily)
VIGAAPGDVQRQLEDVVRIEGGRILAVLAAATGDLQLSEDAVQDATVAALEVWARTGIPRNPTGWLYVAARRKAIDVVRRESTRDRREAAASLPSFQQLDADPPAESRVRDDVLRLIFTCSHPALAREARVALALRTLCGLSTAEVARALLVSEPTMAKRLVRAKQKIARAAIPYRIPPDDELAERLSSVYAVIHLVYTAGHHAAGDDVVRADLCEEAVRLARLVVGLLPGDASGEALLALLLLTEARRPSRVAADGSLVPLAEQDRGRWDTAAIEEGLALLRRSLGRSDGVADPYQLQAAIAACHSTAASFDATDWPEIVRLYGILAEVHPNPVVDLNAAIARAEVDGPDAALDALDRVDPAARSHLWQAGRAEMLLRLDRHAEAVDAFRRALAQAPTEAERRHLQGRLRVAAATGPRQ